MFRPKLWEIPQPNTQVKAGLIAKIATLTDRLRSISEKHHQARFATSLAVEDMLITDIIAKHRLNIGVFTLETGLLPAQTLALLEKMATHYPHLTIQLFHPNGTAVQNYINEFGAHAFYDSVERRKQCCFIRKIEPLNRALVGADAWLTGQRREQSVTRTDLPFEEADLQRNIAKYNPIFDWSEQEVWAYILQENVPYNALYQQGYPSIGCDPCSKPVKAGEDIRAGRWWWEQRDSKECGLHVHNH